MCIMRNTVKDKTQRIQEGSGGKVTRPPDVPVRPGVWRGHPNPGGFQKGDPRIQSGVISRAKQRTIEAVATEYADEAMNTLAGLIRSDSTPPAVKEKAANAILDRAFGRTVDRVAVAQINDEGKGSGKVYNRDELMRILTDRYRTDQESYQTLEHDGAIPDAS